jgi:hypothetical protein
MCSRFTIEKFMISFVQRLISERPEGGGGGDMCSKASDMVFEGPPNSCFAMSDRTSFQN